MWSCHYIPVVKKATRTACWADRRGLSKLAIPWTSISELVSYCQVIYCGENELQKKQDAWFCQSGKCSISISSVTHSQEKLVERWVFTGPMSFPFPRLGFARAFITLSWMLILCRSCLCTCVRIILSSCSSLWSLVTSVYSWCPFWLLRLARYDAVWEKKVCLHWSSHLPNTFQLGSTVYLQHKKAESRQAWFIHKWFLHDTHTSRRVWSF